MSVDSVPGTAWIATLARHGDCEALACDGLSVGYAALATAATMAARGLAVLGVESGDIVAVLAPPSRAGVALIHAMLDQRIVLLPLNERLSEDELEQTLERTGARFLLTAREGDEAVARRLAEAAGCGLLFMRPDVSSPDVESPATDRSGDLGFAPELECERSPDPSVAADHTASRTRRLAEGAAIVMQTSGTSGRPKGAVLGFDNLIASAEGSARLLGASPQDRWLLCMPLFHIGGLSILIRSATSGASVLLHRRFDPAAVAKALESDRVTRVSFVAAMLARLLTARAGQRAPETLDLVLLGGGPTSQALLFEAAALGYPIAPTYGLTEATSQVATRPPDIRPAESSDLASGLQPLPGVEIRIVDEQGSSVAMDIEGEIQVRGPIVMHGYLDDPEATRRALREGWLATGDIGRLDAHGHLRVLDRRTDLIVSGGENVYPAEIESRLAEHPGIEEACVVGVDDEVFGTRPIAFVVARTGTRLDGAELDAFCREKLAGYKIPVDFIERERLPRTASGKLLRRALAITKAARPD